jgi:hypothetical protein
LAPAQGAQVPDRVDHAALGAGRLQLDRLYQREQRRAVRAVVLVE